MLTKKQLQLLLFIDGHLKDNGTAPSFDEMKAAVNLKSKSGIHRLVSALEERGFLRRLPHRARALEVTKLPRSYEKETSREFKPELIDSLFTSPKKELIPENSATADIPLYGRIAAGIPIEALRNDSNIISVPTNLLGRGKHYALEIEGDSMNEAGILDGDIAIIEECKTAENGNIIVALIDETEVTLKRIRSKGESVALEPANKTYEPRIFGPGRVRVQGRLAGLIRNYN